MQTWLKNSERTGLSKDHSLDKELGKPNTQYRIVLVSADIGP